MFFSKMHEKLDQIIETKKETDVVLEDMYARLSQLEDKIDKNREINENKICNVDENVDNLLSMLKEYKGMVTTSRACLKESKSVGMLKEEIVSILELVKAHDEKFRNSLHYAIQLHDQYFKINALYTWLINDHEPAQEKIEKEKS